METPPLNITFTDEQIQSKFRHAADFGIHGNYDKEKAALFAKTLTEHVQNPSVKQIIGTYRGDAVIHYFEEASKLNVMTSLDGIFISGWKLNEAQAKNVGERGSL